MFTDAASSHADRPGLSVGRTEGIGDELHPLDASADLLGGGFPVVDIAPLGGRLLAFWSDRMVHGVNPSFAASEGENRWALTVWLQTEDPTAIDFDPEAESKHFVSMKRLKKALGQDNDESA